MSQASGSFCVEIPLAAGLGAEPWSLRKVWGLLKCFGPAAILASMSVGAGETIVVVRTGAWASYDLLWVVLLACLVKGVFVTYMLGRYTAISGEYIGHRLVHLPGPRGWFLLLIIGVEVLFAPLAWVAIAKPCGDLMHYLMVQNLPSAIVFRGASETSLVNVFTTLFLTSALIVGLTHTYQRLEKQQLIICGILVLGTTAGTAMVWPDMWQAVKGTFFKIGDLPELPPWTPADAQQFPWLTVATVFAYVGGSVTSYVVYANWVGIRGWGLTGHPQIEQIRQRAASSPRIDYLPHDPEQRRRLQQLAAPLLWDIALGAALLFLVTASFMVAGAAVLYDQHTVFEGWTLLTHQAHVWRNIHAWLAPVYYVTVMAALWGTLASLPEVYARVTHEFSHAIWPDSRWSYEAIRRVIALAIFIESSVIIWWNLQFDILTQIAGLFLANLAVALVAVAAFYLNHKLPPAYRVRGIFFAGAVLASAILIAASSMSTYGLLRKLLG